ncbi:MAG: hypothetical protein ACI91O_000478 [Candidatus Poriferisodalaceae bacterium]|jgi:hypothetical protein
MLEIDITPNEFTMVFYDAAVIAEVAAEVAGKVGFPEGTPISLVVDEEMPLGRSKVTSYDPVEFTVDGGAFEDSRRPRNMSKSRTSDVLGRLMLRVMDRTSGKFDDAPADDEIDLALHAAWDAHSVGRLERLGFASQRKRRIYQFRNRHGFTDRADQAFDELWGSNELAWADIERISTDCRAAFSG